MQTSPNNLPLVVSYHVEADNGRLYQWAYHGVLVCVTVSIHLSEHDISVAQLCSPSSYTTDRSFYDPQSEQDCQLSSLTTALLSVKSSMSVFNKLIGRSLLKMMKKTLN